MSVASGAYAKPLPRIDERNRPHWEGARAGEVRLQRCLHCGTLRYSASRWCPQCLGDETEWVATNGKGKVWSWCAFHKAYFKGFASEVPYGGAIVKREEGVKVYSSLVDVPKEKIR